MKDGAAISLPPVRDLGPVGRIDEVLAVFLVVAAHARIRRDGAERTGAMQAGLHCAHVVAAAPVAVLTLDSGEAGGALEVEKAVPRSIADGVAPEAVRVVLRPFPGDRFIGVGVGRSD